MEYTIRKTTKVPELSGDWDDPIWSKADTLKIESFHPQGSNHKPDVWVRSLYDAQTIYVHFRVLDQYVRSVTTHTQGPVCQDSCVEFFFTPKPGGGYLNLEANCGGTFLCSYIEPSHSVPIDPQWLAKIPCHHTLPKSVNPEIATPCEWRLAYALPIALIEAYTGPLGPIAGQTWRANYYKCGDKTSHPHWGSWAPIGEKLSFHQPSVFAPVHFQA